MRSFLAFALPEKLKEKLLSLQAFLEKNQIETNLVTNSNFHLTLVFFPDLPEKKIPDLLTTLSEKITLFSPIRLQLETLGVFPNLHRPQVIWVGTKKNPLLEQLSSTIRKAILSQKINFDQKPFKTHLSLARIKKSSYSQRKLIKKIILQTKVDLSISLKKIVLYQSQLTSSGPKHIPLKTFILEDK